MVKHLNSILATRLGLALVVSSGLLLAGCQLDDAALEDHYVRASVAERYPIKVKKAPVKMGVSAAWGALKPDQVNAVVNFANEAKRSSTSRISLKWPSGSANSSHVAREIAQVLVAQGVPAAMIKASSYPGNAGRPIELSFVRKVAVTRECGDWSQNLAVNPTNGPYPNFGCSMQNNVAAMVSNPADFETPRAMPPVDATNRTVALAVYQTNETAGDYWKLKED